ncbi:DUF6875 domain-containing protein [Amycolatopsis pithecellobii]|uniref:DUF6875 domain-containing protein n=1 Tax=Amycolatopsis pithecellobii TaxID=664692 RepID=A0A6N7YYB1_9PSEU|nr:hypothetical protein [Amycolatopsis pithecellobii]MTD53339.1 hypothetical protein [Amycolatopsis pithecellobii]
MTLAAPARTVEESLRLVDEWLTTYICRPRPEIPRPGAVCPFVEPAQRAGSLEIRVRLVGPAPSLPLVTEIIRCVLEEFEANDWRRRTNPALRALMVTLPDLPADRLTLLDQAHAAVKDEAVARGLMIGQFHQECAEPSARNHGFPVSRSPVPLVVVRRMALHDVLFLHERADWFATYASRFGRQLEHARDSADPLFLRLYDSARG